MKLPDPNEHTELTNRFSFLPGIDEFDGLEGVLNIDDWQNWSEYFVLHDRIFWLDIHQNCWRNVFVVGICGSAEGNIRPFQHRLQTPENQFDSKLALNSTRSVRLHSLEIRLIDDSTQIGAFLVIFAIPFIQNSFGFGDKLSLNLFAAQQVVRRNARLPVVDEFSPQNPLRRGRNVNGVVDVYWTFAAQFQRHWRQIFIGGRMNDPSHTR